MSQNHEFVTEMYSAVKACLRAMVAVRERIDGLYDADRVAGGAVVDLKVVKDAVDAALTTLDDKTAPAREAVEALKPYVNAVQSDVVDYGPCVAASFAEAVVKRAERLLREAEPAESIDPRAPGPPDWVNGLRTTFRHDANGHVSIEVIDVEEGSARLDQEAGRLEMQLRRENVELRGYVLGLYRAEGRGVVFDGVLRHLQGYQREFLKLLILAGGAPVTFELLYRALYGPGEINEKQVKWVRDDLVRWMKEHELSNLAKCIHGMKGSYRLDLGDYRRT